MDLGVRSRCPTCNTQFIKRSVTALCKVFDAQRLTGPDTVNHRRSLVTCASGMATIPSSTGAQDDVSQPKYGFVLFRTDHSNEIRWEQFMKYLNSQVEARMRTARMVHEIPNIDWKVQDIPELDGASFEVVRE
jgi:hypothetical protein